MLGQIILPLVVIFGSPSPVETFDGGVCSTSAEYESGDALECRPTACTEFEVIEASGYLLCLDNDMNYPPGHWAYAAAEPEDMELNLQSFGYADIEY